MLLTKAEVESLRESLREAERQVREYDHLIESELQRGESLAPAYPGQPVVDRVGLRGEIVQRDLWRNDAQRIADVLARAEIHES